MLFKNASGGLVPREKSDSGPGLRAKAVAMRGEIESASYDGALRNRAPEGSHDSCR